jgi:ParB/RepB/Spo0J family partition protein
MSQDQIQIIQMDLVDRPVKISRELIDPEKVRELAESIREKGLLQPVILRPCNGRFEMVAGDRRYLAHKLLNLKEIKAIVMELDDRETVEIRGIENLQRENLTPSEEAGVYLLLRDEGGLNANQIAKKTGRSRATIDRYLKFAQCPEYVRKAVDKKEISLLVLETLMEIDDPTAFEYHFKMGASNGINNTVARMWVDDYLKTKTGEYYSEGGSPPTPNVDTVYKPTFVACDCCSGAVDIRQARQVVVCLECLQAVRGSRIGKV